MIPIRTAPLEPFSLVPSWVEIVAKKGSLIGEEGGWSRRGR
jgi:hypothetical protein